MKGITKKDWTMLHFIPDPNWKGVSKDIYLKRPLPEEGFIKVCKSGTDKEWFIIMKYKLKTIENHITTLDEFKEMLEFVGLKIEDLI